MIFVHRNWYCGTSHKDPYSIDLKFILTTIRDDRDGHVIEFSLLSMELRSWATERSFVHKQDNDNKEVVCFLMLRNFWLRVVSFFSRTKLCLFLISAFIIDLTDVHNLQLGFCYLSKNEQRNNNKINMISMKNVAKLIGTTHELARAEFQFKAFFDQSRDHVGCQQNCERRKILDIYEIKKMFWPNLALSHQVFFSLIIQKSKSSMWRNSFFGKIWKKLIKLMSHKKLASKIECFSFRRNINIRTLERWALIARQRSGDTFEKLLKLRITARLLEDNATSSFISTFDFETQSEKHFSLYLIYFFRWIEKTCMKFRNRNLRNL